VPKQILLLDRPLLGTTDFQRILNELIKLEGLAKRFGQIEAVRGISFTVGRGEVLGFLGPNGAGKSTTMKMLAGFLTPSAGSAWICGHDVVADGLAAKRCLGYLPEGAPAYPDMTTGSFLKFVAQIRGFHGAEAREKVAAAIGRLDLGSVVEQPIDTLSKGFKRRVGLAQALMHDPEVLILDEPTDGLDPNQKHEVRGLIQAMAANKAIIISTHILEEVDAVCTRAMIIANGRVLADGTPGELEARSVYHHAVFVALAEPMPAAVKAEIAALPGVASLEVPPRAQDRELYVLARDNADLLGQVRGVLDRHRLAPTELRLERGRLETVFRTITAAAA
jgi:ABC-2 type transport system ATP-binding protein